MVTETKQATVTIPTEHLKALTNAAASPKDGRLVLTGVYVDPAGWLVAANGFILAAHKVTLDVPEDFKGAILPSEFCKLKFANSLDVVIDIEEKTVKGIINDGTVVTNLIVGDFPSWHRLVPDAHADKPQIPHSYNPSGLVKLQKALNRDLGLPLELWESDTPMSPGLFISDDCVGVIMPMTVEPRTHAEVASLLERHGFTA